MYQEDLFIIYIGEVDMGKSLQKAVESYGWNVKIAIEVMPTLAMYVFYFPDIVIIDDIAKSDLAKLSCSFWIPYYLPMRKGLSVIK